MPARISPQHALITIGLVIFMAFSVFAFAATEDWAAATCEVMLFLLAGWAGYKDPHFFHFPKRLWAPFFMVIALLITALVQLVPLPVRYWQWIGDERGSIQERALEGETLLRSDLYRTEPFTGRLLPQDKDPIQTPPPKSSLPATFTPLLTTSAWVALMAAAMLVLLIESLSKGPRNSLGIQSMAVGIVGLAVGFLGLVHFREAPTKLLGVRESTHAGDSFGPFVNENNGMGFVNIAFFFLYYLLWCRILREKRISNRAGLGIAGLSLLGLHAALLASRTSEIGFWPFLLLPGVLILHFLRRRPRLALILGYIALFSVGAFSFVVVHYRFTDLHGRLNLWHNVLDQSHWLIGNGLGSFGDRFQAVLRHLPVLWAVNWSFPENEYIQLIFEAGLVGVGIALFAACYLLRLGWKAIMAGGSTFILVPALWGEALHAATDFTFHLWPMVFAAILLIANLEVALNSEKRQGGGERA